MYRTFLLYPIHPAILLNLSSYYPALLSQKAKRRPYWHAAIVKSQERRGISRWGEREGARTRFVGALEPLSIDFEIGDAMARQVAIGPMFDERRGFITDFLKQVLPFQDPVKTCVFFRSAGS